MPGDCTWVSYIQGKHPTYTIALASGTSLFRDKVLDNKPVKMTLSPSFASLPLVMILIQSYVLDPLDMLTNVI